MLGRMNDKARLTIATAVTAAFIAAISLAGVSAHSSKPLGAVVHPSAGAQTLGPSNANATPWHQAQEHD
jgi:hypothetical protein